MTRVIFVLVTFLQITLLFSCSKDNNRGYGAPTIEVHLPQEQYVEIGGVYHVQKGAYNWASVTYRDDDEVVFASSAQTTDTIAAGSSSGGQPLYPDDNEYTHPIYFQTNSRLGRWNWNFGAEDELGQEAYKSIPIYVHNPDLPMAFFSDWSVPVSANVIQLGSADSVSVNIQMQDRDGLSNMRIRWSTTPYYEPIDYELNGTSISGYFTIPRHEEVTAGYETLTISIRDMVGYWSVFKFELNL